MTAELALNLALMAAMQKEILKAGGGGGNKFRKREKKNVRKKVQNQNVSPALKTEKKCQPNFSGKKQESAFSQERARGKTVALTTYAELINKSF